MEYSDRGLSNSGNFVENVFFLRFHNCIFNFIKEILVENSRFNGNMQMIID